MKVVLTAINAKYIHTNPAVYLLRANAGVFRDMVTIKEFTVNQSPDDILREIVEEEPDFIGFSTYIWNLDMVKKVVPECNKLLPRAELWLGGPEAEAGASKLLSELPMLSGIMYGEGEAVFSLLLQHFEAKKTMGEDSDDSGADTLSKIPGLIYLDKHVPFDEGETKGQETEKICTKVCEQTKLHRTALPTPLSLDALCFPYDKKLLSELSGKIIYYESSRGCPFHCSYCLSSKDNRVRFRSVEKVTEDLLVFLEAGTPKVKLVDRTFNCNHERTEALLRFLLLNDNKVTGFHFEISAELLTETELTLLSQFRPGAVQLEIGVQTTNPTVLETIGRSSQTEKLFSNIKTLLQFNKQHIHLDLIAGLPGEDMESFLRSFDAVYSLHPHQLQIGFLKVLKNTGMFEDAEKYGIQYRDYPPYEVLCTASICYAELQIIKQVEEMVEIFYNSGQFEMLLCYAEHQEDFSPFAFYQGLSERYFRAFSNGMQSSRMARYELLLSYMKDLASTGNDRRKISDTKRSDEKTVSEQEYRALTELAVYDCYARERKRARPSFSPENKGERLAKEWAQEGKTDFFYNSSNHAEHFTIDIKRTAQTGSAVLRDSLAIFDYERRSAITGNAAVSFYEIGEST